MVEIRKTETKAAPPPTPVATAPEPKKTDAELAAEKAKKESDALLGPAYDKSAKANANLAKDGSGNRIEPEVRSGEVRYKWGNFVPTRFMTDDEQAAVEGIKKPSP